MKRKSDFKYIASFSGGKDSSAMILLIKKHKLPLDEIRYFDAGSWEHPETIEHVEKFEKYINFPITRVTGKHTLSYYFGRKKTKRGNLGWGFPGINYRWCTGIKVDAVHKGLRSKTTLYYIGIAADETHRFDRIQKRNKHVSFPLRDYGFSQKDSLKMCLDLGFDWGGLYQLFSRNSCWCCPFMTLRDLKTLYDHRPKLWKKLLKMQKRSKRPFHSGGSKVDFYDELFRTMTIK